MQSLMTSYEISGTSQSSNTNSMLLLKRLDRKKTMDSLYCWISWTRVGRCLSYAWFGTPLTIIFDGADFSTGQMVPTSSPEIATLSSGWPHYIPYSICTADCPTKLFFENPKALKDQNHRNWAVLKKGRSIKQLWMIAMVGVAGMALDGIPHAGTDQ